MSPAALCEPSGSRGAAAVIRLRYASPEAA